MKKQLLNIIFTFVLTPVIGTIADAQGMKASKDKGQPDYMIGLTGGLSSAGGNFTKTDYSDPKSGFAGSGFNAGITGTWFVKKNFGITALISYHGYSVAGLQHLADGFKHDFDIDSSTVTNRGSNYTMNFLAGPYYSLPLSKKISLDGRLMVGLVSAHMAGFEVNIEDQSEATFSQKEASAATFGAQIGMGVRYNITPALGIMLNVDYFYSKPNFTIENANRNNNAGRLITSYNEPVSGLNSNITLVYLLKH